MQDPDEIDLTNLDYRTITHEQWTLLKAQVVRRAQAERAKAVREMFDRLIFWREKKPAARPFTPTVSRLPM